MNRSFARFAGALTLVALVCGGVPAARAVNIQVAMPIVTTTPGSTVDIPIDASHLPVGQGIYSIDMRLPYDPAVVQSAVLLGDGFIQTWGPPFVNAAPSFLAAAAAGGTTVVSGSTRIATLRLTLKPGVPVGTNMPLVFEHFWFNENSPPTWFVNGEVRVRSSLLEVEGGTGAAFALAPAAPSPARASTRLAFTLPTGGAGRARLAVYGVDGRLVRTIEDGVLAAGPHSRTWDLKDAAGSRVAAGMYFVRLESTAGRLERRLVVIR